MTVTLTAGSPAYLLEYQVEPYLWPGRYHPLYVSAPFENEKLECVSYPMEAPILPPYHSHWFVRPDVGKVPFLLGREQAGDSSLYVGIGYTWRQPGRIIPRGCSGMTAPKRARPSRRFPIYSLLDSSAEQLGGQQRAEGRHLCGGQPTQKRVFPPWGPYVCSVIVSVADTQADCVFGYRDICGFNSDTCSKYDVMKAVRQYAAWLRYGCPVGL